MIDLETPPLLNEAQADAVYAKDPVLCCACPGSGKTAVQVERAAHLLTTFPRARVVMTTFSRAAANEMARRIRTRCGAAAASRITVGNFHTLSLKQLKDTYGAKYIGRILDDIEVEHLVRVAIARLDPHGELAGQLEAEGANERIARCRMSQEAAKDDPVGEALAKEYVKLLRERKAWDFTDIMVEAVDGMMSGKVKPLPNDYFLGDEYQDIDAIQFRWMMETIRAGSLPCVVGDDDQSVYGFRRALGYQGMMDFVAATGARIITLGTNYRSTVEILDYASQLISHNVNRVAKHMQSARGPGHAPIVRFCNGPQDQLDYLMSVLPDICRDNPLPQTPAHGKPYLFGVKPKQVAILARTNSHLTPIEITFLTMRVPYVRSGKGVMADKGVMAYCSLLMSLNRGDDVGLEVALRWARVRDADIHELAALGGGSIRRVLEDHSLVPGGGRIVRSFVEAARRWRTQARYKIEGVIYGTAGWMTSVLDGSCGLDPDEIEALEEPSRPNKRSMAAIGALRDLLASTSGSLQQRMMLAKRDRADDMPRVVLSTFHTAKGLEWDHVFLVDVVDGVVPSKDSTSADALEEERRLLYVGFTRARNQLHILTSKRRGISEFLYEAGLVAAPHGQAETINPESQTEDQNNDLTPATQH